MALATAWTASKASTTTTAAAWFQKAVRIAAQFINNDFSAWAASIATATTSAARTSTTASWTTTQATTARAATTINSD